MRWKNVATVAAGAVVLLALAAAVLAMPVLWLVIDESAVPPASDAPSLPDGVRATAQEVNCGSGGCWREWTLSGTELSVRLDLSGENCAARSLLDRREVCTGFYVVDGEVRLYQRFDSPLR